MGLGSAAAAFVSPLTHTGTVKKWNEGDANMSGVGESDVKLEQAQESSGGSNVNMIDESKLDSDDSDSDDDLPLSRGNRRAHISGSSRHPPKTRSAGPGMLFEAMLYDSDEHEIENDINVVELEGGYARARCGRNGRLLYDVITADAFRRFKKRQRRGERIVAGAKLLQEREDNLPFEGDDSPRDEFIRKVDEDLHMMDMKDEQLEAHLRQL